MAERGPDGRFLPGNKTSHKGGARGGRPRRETEEKYLKAMSETVSIDDWILITRVAVHKAKNGDRYARQWLSEYLIGKPTEYKIVDADVETAQVTTLLSEIRSALTDEPQ